MYHLQTFGGVALTDPAGGAIRLRSRKHLALLLYLAANGRRVHTRPELASLLWETPASRARHSLSQAVYDLRRRLEGLVIDAPAEEVRLDPTRVRLDVTELEEAVRQGDLARAVRLYRGPFACNLGGLGTGDFQRWLDAERARLQHLAQLALRHYLQECDARAQWGEMCVAAVQLVAMNPLDEEAHRGLMRALWLHGDRSSALRHYDETVAYLARELPGGVSEETRALAERIRATLSVGEPERRRLDPSPLVGRTTEFEALKGVVRQLRKPEGGSLVVQGEAGIGKTRLMQELVRWMSLEPVRVLESRCYAAEADVAYGPVVDALGPIVEDAVASTPEACRSFTRLGNLFPQLAPFLRPELDQSVDPAAWRRRLYEEAAELLRTTVARRPIVWVVEDVHWIDATSRSFLHYVSRRLIDHPFLVMMTERVERGAPPTGGIQRDESLFGDGVARIVIGPLSDSEIDRVVVANCPEARGHPAAALARRLAAGNPFFALEVFRAAAASTDWIREAKTWDPLTDARLSDVFAIRFRDMSPEALRVLQATSVLDRHATCRNVSHLARLSPTEAADHATDLFARGLLVDGPQVLSYSNDIVREYVYGQMTSMQTVALHLTAGEMLENQLDVGAATLARHFYLGNERPKTFKYAMRAGTEASEAGGHLEAAALAAMALDTARGAEETLRALRLLARSELLSAQLEAAQQHYLRILELDTEMPLAERIETKLHVVETMAGVGEWSGVLAAVHDLFNDTRLLRPRSLRLDRRFELFTWQMRAATRTNDRAAALSLRVRIARLRMTAAHAGHLTASADVRALCAMAACASFYQSSEEALSLLEACSALESQISVDLVNRARVLRGIAHLRLAQWDYAEYESRQALARVEPKNDVLQTSAVLNNLVCCALEQGAWERAEDLIEQVHRLTSALSPALDVSLPLAVNAANVAFYRGEAEKAHAMYSKALRVAKDTRMQEFLLELEACVGLTALQIGKRDAVQESWAAVRAVPDAQLQGMQERFKLEWFRTYMLRRREASILRQRLIALALALKGIDKPGHLKIRWLCEMLLPCGDDQTRTQLLAELKDVSLGWFARFSERWLRSASSHRWTGIK